MTLEIFEHQVEAVRAEGERLRNSSDDAVVEIRNDPRLSDEGKQEALEDVREDVKSRLMELRAKEDQLIDVKINELELRLDAKTGNTSSDIIAFRDAQDRAERIEDAAEARRILDRALRGGDTSLAHAVFRQALERGWPDVKAAFIKAHPDASDVVNDLSRLIQFRGETFARTIQYSFLA